MKEKQEHTKTPWIIKRGDKFQQERIITTASRVRGRKVPICKLDVEFNGRIGVEQKANAHLLAAAPDLLAACERFLNPTDEGPRLEDVIRDAVAKAKGGVAE